MDESFAASNGTCKLLDGSSLPPEAGKGPAIPPEVANVEVWKAWMSTGELEWWEPVAG